MGENGEQQKHGKPSTTRTPGEKVKIIIENKMLKATQQDQGQEERGGRGQPVKDGRKRERKQKVNTGKGKVGTETRGRTGRKEEEWEKEHIEPTGTREKGEEKTSRKRTEVKLNKRVEQK